jgi:hypothetical protein
MTALAWDLLCRGLVVAAILVLPAFCIGVAVLALLGAAGSSERAWDRQGFWEPRPDGPGAPGRAPVTRPYIHLHARAIRGPHTRRAGAR